MASWPTLYIAEANKTGCGIVLASALADAFGGKLPSADVFLSQSIVPLLASGKLAEGAQVPVLVFAGHVLARHNRHNPVNMPVREPLAKAWRDAGFTGQGFGGATPDKPTKAAEWLRKVAKAPALTAKAPMPTSKAKPASKPAKVQPVKVDGQQADGQQADGQQANVS